MTGETPWTTNIINGQFNLYTVKSNALNYPVFVKNLLSLSHLSIVRQPFEKLNTLEASLTKGWQGFDKGPMPYISLSCKVPPNLIFIGENAACHHNSALYHTSF